MPHATSSPETRYEPQQHADELPPGHFISDELQSDCSRFLDEIRDVVRRRSEAGLARERYG